jgi:hypothetical protein
VFGLGLGAVASQAGAATELRGGGYLTDFVGCEEYGWSGVVPVIVRLRPSGLPGNSDTVTRIAITLSQGQQILHIDDSGETDVLVHYYLAYTNAYDAAAGASVNFLRVFPQDVTETSPFVEGVMRIERFDDLDGCSARLGAYMVKR